MYRTKRRPQSNKCEKSKRGRTNQKGTPANLRKIPKLRKRNNSTNAQDQLPSQRVTVPLGFFNQGVKSKIVRRNGKCLPKSVGKNEKDSTVKEQNGYYLQEDLHALLQTVSGSSPDLIQKEPSPLEQTHYENVTDYYVKLKLQQTFSQKSPEPPQDENSGNSSIFKKVNCLFRETVNKQDTPNISTEEEKSFQTFSCNSSPLTNTFNVNPNCFCKNLKEKLHSVTLTNRRDRCFKRIAALITETNAILEGEETIFPAKVEMKDRPSISTREVNDAVSQLIPKSSWLYRTPNGQKLRRPVIASGSTKLKPCIIQRDFQSKVIFELDKSPANLDFLNTLATPLSDISNSATLSNFNENFKMLPLINQNVQSRKNAMSVFNNTAVPFFEDIPEPFQSRNSRKLPVPNRPSKSATNIREHSGTPRCLFFETTRKRKKIREGMPQTGAPNTFPAGTCHTFSLCATDCNNKDNYRPQDMSNHPKATPFTLDDSFIVDDNFLFPPIPNLRDPSPVSFYPRKVFDTE